MGVDAAFLRHLRCKYSLILRGERAPRKRGFLLNIFQKVRKNAIWPVFSKFCLRRRNFYRVFLVLWQSSKNLFGRPKKKVDKILENFLKIQSRKNPRSTPACNINDQDIKSVSIGGRGNSKKYSSVLFLLENWAINEG